MIIEANRRVADKGDQGMARGGRRKDRTEPERRCIATGESQPARGLIRFALSPDGVVVPDVSGNLPGRGAWVSAERAALTRAVKRRLFARAFRQPAETPSDLPDRVEALLARRLVDLISLARKAGQAVTGAEKTRARITGGTAAVILQASDGARDGREKIARLADAAGNGDIGVIECLSSEELGLAFGRDFAIHAALDSGGFAGRICAEARRLSGVRTPPAPGATDDARTGRDEIERAKTERANPAEGQADPGGQAGS